MTNRFLSTGRAMLGASFIFLTLLSCGKEDDVDMVQTGTVTETVVARTEFSTLESAVIKANLQATLDGPGPFTVFAPDNDAFTASGVSSATLNSLTQQQVADILLYHTLGAKVMAAAVPAGPNAKVITASGDSVFVTKNASGVYVNGVKVQQADINASNGVIHRIGMVLMPPMGDLVATAQSAGSGLDSLVKAIVRVNNAPGGDPTIIATLQSATLTAFAPNNNAFTQLLSALGLSDIGYRLGEDWAIEFQLLGLARPAKLVPGQITADDSYSTAEGPYSTAQFLPSRCYLQPNKLREFHIYFFIYTDPIFFVNRGSING